MTPCIWNR